MAELTEAMKASLGILRVRAVPPAKLLDSDGASLELFEVPPAGSVIGRDEDADVTLVEPDGYISRRHLLLSASALRWTAVDLTSTHGTRLLTSGGTSVDLIPEVLIELAGGDRLILAHTAAIEIEIEAKRRKGRSTRQSSSAPISRVILQPPLDYLAFELLRPRREQPGSTGVPTAAWLAEKLSVSERSVYTYRDQLATTAPLARRLASNKPSWREIADAVAAVYPYLAAPIREASKD